MCLLYLLATHPVLTPATLCAKGREQKREKEKVKGTEREKYNID